MSAPKVPYSEDLEQDLVIDFRFLLTNPEAPVEFLYPYEDDDEEEDDD